MGMSEVFGQTGGGLAGVDVIQQNIQTTRLPRFAESDAS